MLLSPPLTRDPHPPPTLSPSHRHGLALSRALSHAMRPGGRTCLQASIVTWQTRLPMGMALYGPGMAMGGLALPGGVMACG